MKEMAKTLFEKYEEIINALAPVNAMLPELDETNALSVVCMMFDLVCEEKGIDKEDALKAMNTIITKVNMEYGDMNSIRLAKKKTVKQVLENYLSKELAEVIIEDLKEAALIDSLKEILEED